MQAKPGDQVDLTQSVNCANQLIADNKLSGRPYFKIQRGENSLMPVSTTRHEIILDAHALKLIGFSDQELEALLAHELYHFEHQHWLKRTSALCGTMLGTGVAIALRRPQLRKKISTIATKIVAPAVGAGFGANWVVGRYQEVKADEFAMRAGKAAGLLASWKRAQAFELQNEAELAHALAQASPERQREINNFLIVGAVAKFITPHPSYEQRIKTAEAYLRTHPTNWPESDKR